MQRCAARPSASNRSSMSSWRATEPPGHTSLDELAVDILPIHVDIGDCPPVSILVKWLHAYGTTVDQARRELLRSSPVCNVRYLEARLMEDAKAVGRYELENINMTGARLPESDKEDMEVFLEQVRQVLPLLGSDILTPITVSQVPESKRELLYCENKGASAKGRRTETGFVVFADSTAVLRERPSAETKSQYVVDLRRKLIKDTILLEMNDLLVFTKYAEFNSPSQAASVIHGGSANGLTAWKDEKGRTLKQIEENDTEDLPAQS